MATPPRRQTTHSAVQTTRDLQGRGVERRQASLPSLAHETENDEVAKRVNFRSIVHRQSSCRISPSKLFKFCFDARVHLHRIADLLLLEQMSSREGSSLFWILPRKAVTDLLLRVYSAELEQTRMSISEVRENCFTLIALPAMYHMLALPCQGIASL